MARIAGKLGRSGTRHIDTLKYRQILPTPPTWNPPPSATVIHGITTWGMDGNDKYGDCGPAAMDHYQVSKSGNVGLINKLGGFGPLPLYFSYGKSQGEQGTQPDQGVVNATWLLYLYHQKIIEGMVELDHTNKLEINQAMIDFGGVLLGVDLTPTAQNQFESHEPWNVSTTQQPTPQLGHDILLVKFDPTGGTIITWGGIQRVTNSFLDVCVQTAWVIVTSVDASRVGINMATLVSIIESLGGSESI